MDSSQAPAGLQPFSRRPWLVGPMQNSDLHARRIRWSVSGHPAGGAGSWQPQETRVQNGARICHRALTVFTSGANTDTEKSSHPRNQGVGGKLRACWVAGGSVAHQDRNYGSLSTHRLFSRTLEASRGTHQWGPLS